jgi:hypothetical protein
MVLSKAEINKRYREKNSQKIKENRKKIDILCPDCNVIRNVRADVKRKTNLCPKCNMRKIRIDNGEILHGLSNHPLFIRWNGMKCRVNDIKKRNSYLDKNITVCDEWKHNFLSFYDWAISNGFKENLEIDRINNNGNYCPENCRWISHIEHCNNKK